MIVGPTAMSWIVIRIAIILNKVIYPFAASNMWIRNRNVNSEAESNIPRQYPPLLSHSIAIPIVVNLKYKRELHMWSIDRLVMRLLFVCVGNSCRSQMAEGLARSMGHTADSAGTHPNSATIAPYAQKYLHSRDINTDGMVPKSVDDFSAEDYDMVISMGCGVHCPAMKIDEDWGLDDPFGGKYDFYKTTAEEIERRLKLLES
jgi:arsenate reductase